MDNSNDDDAEQQHEGRWFPPGAEPEQRTFQSDFSSNFKIPTRLMNKNASMVTAVNDFHFAMMNDGDRNTFYHEALRKVVSGKRVLEIGAGSGLLSMIAAKEGAAHVYAVEASVDMVKVARDCIAANGLTDKITLINALSTNITIDQLGGQAAEVLVSEILGTMLLGEGALDYVSDARERLLTPNAHIIPAAGCQYATLIQSKDIESITRVQGWGGFDLQGFNQLQDTVSVVFSKQYGFRMSSVDYSQLSPSIPVLDVDFGRHGPGSFPCNNKFRFRATQAGVVHAVLCTWEVFADHTRTASMSTDPAATINNFPRDMQWGQALQLVEDVTVDGDSPQPLIVQAGDHLELEVFTTPDNVSLQFHVRKLAQIVD